MDYIRERFWRGYSFPSLPQANRDMIAWLEETANQRIHGTHRQPILGRWKEEIPCLGKLPLADYDTSLKVFRKVYKDCQLSYNGNRYKVLYQAIGKKVMLKVKGQLIRIYTTRISWPATRNHRAKVRSSAIPESMNISNGIKPNWVGNMPRTKAKPPGR